MSLDSNDTDESLDACRYRYRPLPSGKPATIRTMLLLPGKFDDTLVCRIEDIAITSFRSEALSYVWGQPGGDKVLHVQVDRGAIRTKPTCHILPITKNLDVVLRYMRWKYFTRTMWVDAVCINQDDIEEKQAQISLMTRIYSQASRTVLWLGEESNAGAVRLIFLSLKIVNLVTFPNSPNFIRKLTARLEGWTTMLIAAVIGFRQLNSDHVLYRPWFERVWTLQEALLSPNPQVVCGTHTIPWAVLRYAAYATFHDESTIPLPNSARYRLSHTGLHDSASVTRKFSVQLLLDISLSYTTNPQDKVMGILSILEKMEIDMPAVDYSMGIVQLYAAVTFAFAGHLGSLNWLNLASCRETVAENFPSWIIDFNNGHKYLSRTQQAGSSMLFNGYLDSNLPTIWQRKGLSACRSCLNVPSQHPFDRNALGLGVRGTITKHIVHRFALPYNVSDYLEYSASLYRRRGQLEGDESAQRSEDIAYFQTHLIGHGIDPWLQTLLDSGEENNQEDEGDVAARRLSALAVHLAYNFVNSSPDSERPSEKEGTIAAALKNALYRRQALNRATSAERHATRNFFADYERSWMDLHQTIVGMAEGEHTMFVTDWGHVGMGYCHRVRAGDVIGILEGADLPIVLRPTTAPGNYGFVGPAVVSGMMTGEMWPDDDCDVQDIMLV